MKGKKLNKTSTIYWAIPVLVCLIALLLCACTGTHKKETTSIEKVTNQVAKNDGSDKGKTEDDQEIECRTDAKTGTKFKPKVCATKAEWAIRDAKNKEKSDRFYRDINTPNSGLDSTGGN
jgi:hypothetical protein